MTNKVMDIDLLTTQQVKELLEILFKDTSIHSEKITTLVKMLSNLNKRVITLENEIIVLKVRRTRKPKAQ